MKLTFNWKEINVYWMAFNRNGYVRISKNVEFFTKWNNFLKKVDTESVLYTCYVANKRSIFSSLILILVKHCGH